MLITFLKNLLRLPSVIETYCSALFSDMNDNFKEEPAF